MDVIVRRSEVDGIAYPPPSKSYTHRAFIAASLSTKSRILNALISADTLATLKGCLQLGAEVLRKQDSWIFRGVGEINAAGYFNFENSGTSLRFFASLLALSSSAKFSTLDGDSSLRRRPNRELALALQKLGAKVVGNEQFKAPFKVRGIVRGGDVEMRAASSQFVSSLLFALPLAKFDSTLKVLSVKSKPYIDVTLHVLAESGVEVERGGDAFYIPAQQEFRLRSFEVPADFSSASYLIAAGLLAGRVELRNVFDSMQGDKRIVEICQEMGGKIVWKKSDGVLIAERSELCGIEIDASDIPDLVPTIAVLAATAKGVTRIYNAEHLKLKEIDRIEGIRRNLRALGVEVEAREDGLIIKGERKEFRGVVDSFGDHRMALAFSLLGLLGEVKCRNAEVVAVSYPGFFDVLAALGAEMELRHF